MQEDDFFLIMHTHIQKERASFIKKQKSKKKTKEIQVKKFFYHVLDQV